MEIGDFALQAPWLILHDNSVDLNVLVGAHDSQDKVMPSAQLAEDRDDWFQVLRSRGASDPAQDGHCVGHSILDPVLADVDHRRDYGHIPVETEGIVGQQPVSRNHLAAQAEVCLGFARELER